MEKPKLTAEVRAYMAKLGSLGGRAKSKNKAKTSRENGKLGGRPRKKSK